MKLFVSIPQGSAPMKKFLPEDVKKYLEERFEVTYSPFDRQLTREELKQFIQDKDVVMTGWGSITMDAEMLEGTPVKLIVHTGGSVGSLVTPEVYEMGVRVLSGNELYADSVAEGVIAYMLTALRKIPAYVQGVRDGDWRCEELVSEGLLEQSVGIIGMGAISKRVMKLLQMFHVKIKAYSGYPIDEQFLKENNAVQTSIEEIFATCKVVSLHSSLNERTRGMIEKEHFELMQDGAVFINTARGAIIREEEMIEALKEKRITAILDVYCKEPLAADSELRKLKNVYCMPHKGGPTEDRCPAITKALADDICRFEHGEEMELEISGSYASRMTKSK